MLGRRVSACALLTLCACAGQVVGGATEIDPADLPAEVLRTVAIVQPGGTGIVAERVWSGPEVAFRVVSAYPDPRTPTRTVVARGDGTIVERSHGVGLTVAEQVRDLAAALATARAELGPLDSVEIVHGETGGEWLRARGAPLGGVQPLLDCHLDGSIRRRASIATTGREQ